MAKFAQRSDVAMFLVAQGFDVSLVKAAVNESYNFEPDGDCRDLIWSDDDEDAEKNGIDARKTDFSDEFFPIFVTEEDALKAYHTMTEMMVMTQFGIELDGELLYDLNGDPTPLVPVLINRLHPTDE